MPTPHIESTKDSIAKIVLTSGDPKRCEYIAKNYLEDIKLVNNVRGMTAYTGYYKGKRLTLFPMGIGMSSFGVYAYELYKFYDVEVIIRIGTCGALDKDMEILDTVVLEGSFTESNYPIMLNRDYDTHTALATKRINDLIEETAREEKIQCKKGYGLCNEVFDVYLTDEQFQDMLNHIPKSLNVKVTEMEAFALFYIAQMLNREAACIVTVVDVKSEKDKIITSEEREKRLDNMIKLALNTSLKL